MRFSDCLTTLAADATILESTASFLEKKGESGIAMIDDISYIIEHHDQDDYIRPEFDYSLCYDGDGLAITVDSDDFVNALENDVETITDSVTGVTMKVDDIIQQAADSVSASRVVVVAVRTLAESATESVANITSSFYAKLTLTMGVLNQTASNVASNLLSIITQAGKSVGDRVRDVLDFIGIYNVNTAPDTDIGFPETPIHEVSGANVYAAYFADVPSRLSEVIPWLKELARKIIDLTKNVIATIVGSSTYRALKKFFMTMTLQADSFSYATGDPDDNSIDNMGFGWRKSFDLPTVIEGWSTHSTNTIKDLAILTFGSMMGSDDSDPEPLDRDILYILERASIMMTRWLYEDYPTANEFQSHVLNSGLVYVPNWLSAFGVPEYIPSDGIIGGLYDNIQSLTVYLFTNIFGRYYSQFPSETTSVYQLLQYTLGAYLDYYHINTLNGISNHLNTNQYLKFDLPGSSLYFWLVGNEVVCTRRVVPLTQFKDLSVDEIIDFFEKPFYKMGSTIRMYLGKSTSGDGVPDIINYLRNYNTASVSNDSELMKSCLASNLADAMFLTAMDTMDYHHLDVNYNIPDRSVWRLRPDLQGNVHSWMGFLVALTGHKSNELIALARRDSTSITNLDLATMIGADKPYENFNELWYSNIQVNMLLIPFMLLFEYIDSDEVFIPYVHTASIASGQYQVITDSQLASALSTVIKIVAVVVATVYVMKKIKQLKKKAMAMQTVSDATAWSMIEKGTYDQDAINAQYKMQRRAALCEKLSQSLFGAVTKVVSTVGSSVTSAISSMTAKVKNLLSGGGSENIKDVLDADSDLNSELNRLKVLISG